MTDAHSEAADPTTPPRAEAWAGIDVHGDVMRYAAVERYRGRQRRLLRLGHCDFEFEAAPVLFQEEVQDDLRTMTEALQDAFAGASIEQLRVVLHPPDCYSFFTPVPDGFSPEETEQRLHEEATLLAQTEAESQLQLTSNALYDEVLDGERVRWHHVLGVESTVWSRLERLFEGVSAGDHQAMLSMQAAGRVLTTTQQQTTKETGNDNSGSENDAYGLAIGWYPRHVEFSLSRGAEWRFGHFTSVGSPADCAYFAVALLNRMKLKPQDVGRLRLYGDEVDVSRFDLLERIFEVRPRRLSAVPLLEADAESFTARFNPEAYATCIGAAL
jgi:hypothetical protein